jgi:prepilin-type N-terminal cleavage/methylation domain-containing protein
MQPERDKCSGTGGFTLIEISITLAIIGLIIGSVLVGQDLIRATAIRATIAQIEKYNTAVHTFQEKFVALPGDMPGNIATQFGFLSRGTLPGEGDGNGVLEGPCNGYSCGSYQACGETGAFWEDLSAVNLIEGSYNAASLTSYAAVNTHVLPQTVDEYMPAAKIGKGNYIYVWSGGPTLGWNGGNETGSDHQNYYGLSAVTWINTWALYSSPGLSVQEAYRIDSKIDDGLPQSGKVMAMYIDENSVNSAPTWAGSGGLTGNPYTTATAGSATTCFDNSATSNGSPGVSGANQHYSLEINNGNGVNCALSFGFQ